MAVCALQLRSSGGADAGEEAHRRELDEAFALFVGSGSGGGGGAGGSGSGGLPEAITLTHLKRVAALLRLGEEDGVTEDLLRDMILEANGGAGVAKGVRKDEFDAVMRRAGVWRR